MNPEGPAPLERRPGTLTAAAVLGFVESVLLGALGVGCLAGAQFVRDLAHDLPDARPGPAVLLLVINGGWDLICAALLFGGGVSLLLGHPAGRWVHAGGHVLTLAASGYWLWVWIDLAAPKAAVVVVTATALVSTTMVLTFVGGAGQWLRAQTRQPAANGMSNSR